MMKPLVKILLIIFSLGSYLINAYAIPLKEKEDLSHSDKFIQKDAVKIGKIRVTNKEFEQIANLQNQTKEERSVDTTPASRKDNIHIGALIIGVPVLLSFVGGLIGAIIFKIH